MKKTRHTADDDDNDDYDFNTRTYMCKICLTDQIDNVNTRSDYNAQCVPSKFEEDIISDLLKVIPR